MTVTPIPPVTAHPTRSSRSAASLAFTLAFVAMFASAPSRSFLISVFVDDMLEGTGLSRTAFSALSAGPLPLAVSLQATGGYGAGVVFLAVVSGAALAGAASWREPDSPDASANPGYSEGAAPP